MMGINTLGRNMETENTQTKKTTAAHHLGDFVNHYIENRTNELIELTFSDVRVRSRTQVLRVFFAF